MGEELVAEIQQPVFLNSLLHLLHQADQEAQVVDAGQPRAGDLTRLEQVADIGAGEVLAGVAVAMLVQRPEIVGVLLRSFS